jgi:ABC-type transport system involved in cytochrome bd biosynthesis fused ATPase/permease subunit
MAEAAEQYIEDAGEKTRVSPLDPDFLLFALPFAMIVDAIDIVLELASFLVIPKLIGIGMDIFTFSVIGGWIYFRTNKIIKRRKEQKEALQKQMTQKAGKMEQQLMKGAVKGPLRKTLVRAGVAMLGELIPFVGLIPFWTISVILTLKEKGE